MYFVSLCRVKAMYLINTLCGDLMDFGVLGFRETKQAEKGTKQERPKNRRIE